MLDMVFATPMFDAPPGLFGTPVGTLVVLVAFGGLVAGFLWMRRVTRVDPEPRTFRATTHPEPMDRLVRGLLLAATGFAVVYAVVTFVTR